LKDKELLKNAIVTKIYNKEKHIPLEKSNTID
jgi:hypothetical protein